MNILVGGRNSGFIKVMKGDLTNFLNAEKIILKNLMITVFRQEGIIALSISGSIEKALIAYAKRGKFIKNNALHGVFATRSPSRPNSIGISIVRLIKVEGNTLYIKDVDTIDGTPLLDIKPYVPEFDIRETEKTGWFQKNIHKLSHTKDDGRFIK